MKRWLIALLIVVAACGALMVAVGLVLRSAIRGAEKDKLIASLGEKVGVPISVATVDLDLSEWFHFRPAVALGNVTIGNPPGFHAKDLVDAKTISAQVSLLPLFHKRVEVQSIIVDQPRIVVETNNKGLTNVEAFLKKLSASGGGGHAGTGGATSVAIGQFSVTSGTLTYSGGENVSLHDIDLLVSGFSTDRPCHINLSAKYAPGSVSGFKVEGEAGPFTPDSLPVNATLSLTIAPSEIPAALRREQFGVMLASPGDKSRASLEATIKGDAYGTFAGPAKLTLSRVMIGGHQDHLLPLSGEAPSHFTAASLMSSPQFQLDIPNAKLQLGKGQWTGSADFKLRGKVMAGGTRGAIREIDINEFLSSFTSSSGKVYGLLAMPSSTLRFSGHNAAETLNSLKGTAKISITQGRIAALDLPATLERVFGHPESTAASKGSTNFSTLSANVNIADRQMNVSDLALESPVLRVTGSGVIGFDESINFALVAHVSGGRLGQVISTGPLHMPNVNADIPLTVTGTVQSPQVRPQIGKIAKEAVHETVRGIVGQILKKKLQQPPQ
jgi:uncharacterized protein involved in outer membrane biogenesis